MMNADTIKSLLAEKHSKDVFVTECKDGPTQFGTHLRLDAWAMKKSWANPCMIGYEIKVKRPDFLKDDKWPGYLPLCNELSFVCPTGLISPDELSSEVGLIYTSKNGSRLYTKKKAVYRQIEPPVSLMTYILMCRVKIVDRAFDIGPRDIEDRETRVGYWRKWLAEREEHRELGWRIQSKIGEISREIENENKRLKTRIAEFEDMRRLLEQLGLPPDASRWGVEAHARKAAQAFESWLPQTMRKTADQLKSVADEFDRIRKTANFEPDID